MFRMTQSRDEIINFISMSKIRTKIILYLNDLSLTINDIAKSTNTNRNSISKSLKALEVRNIIITNKKPSICLFKVNESLLDKSLIDLVRFKAYFNNFL